MDTLAPTSTILSREIPWYWRLYALIFVWGTAATVIFLLWNYRPMSGWAGPPIKLNFGRLNPLGDYWFLQESSHFDGDKNLFGLHPYITYRNGQKVVCEDVFHNRYENQKAAQDGILMDPATHVAIHPKMGRRGCWHVLGALP